MQLDSLVVNPQMLIPRQARLLAQLVEIHQNGGDSVKNAKYTNCQECTIAPYVTGAA